MNKFFNLALRKAAMIGGKKVRILILLSHLASKLKRVDWSRVTVSAAREKFNILGRLIKAYATGRYREIPWQSFLITVAAIIYFVSPLDLIPDLIPVAGLTDDVGILAWVFNSLNKEIEKFLIWEQTQLSPQ